MGSGITADFAAEYLSAGVVAVAISGSLVRPALIGELSAEALQENTRRLINGLRSGRSLT
jgi:2-keto-3-deoxy-6-phosphogluconate aldolase